MTSFIPYRRADSTSLSNDHQLYRVWEIPGRRESDYYDGTGIEKTYDLTETDKDYPPDINACPVLRTVELFDGGTVEVMGKNVRTKETMCPDCDVQAIVEPDKKEVFCPECGLLIGSDDGGDLPSLSTAVEDTEAGISKGKKGMYHG